MLHELLPFRTRGIAIVYGVNDEGESPEVAYVSFSAEIIPHTRDSNPEAKLIDFETTLPSAVAELARQRDEHQRA
jgi:hypothetical protein